MSVKLLDLEVFLRGFLDSFLFDLNGFLELDFEEELLGRML
jgi:hypothetical protein